MRAFLVAIVLAQSAATAAVGQQLDLHRESHVLVCGVLTLDGGDAATPF